MGKLNHVGAVGLDGVELHIEREQAPESYPHPRIAAAQRARWAKVRAKAGALVLAPGDRTMLQGEPNGRRYRIDFFFFSSSLTPQFAAKL